MLPAPNWRWSIHCSMYFISYFVVRRRQEHFLFRSEKYFLGLPGGFAIFAFDSFHESNQFTLCADATYTASKGHIFCGFDAMSMTDAFHVIRAELESGPIP